MRTRTVGADELDLFVEAAGSPEHRRQAKGYVDDLLPKGLRPEDLSIEPGRVTVSASSGAARPRCPVRDRPSSRVHSRYTRTVSDLPWHGVTVAIRVRVRRFFCDEPSCERRIFCELLPEVAAHARKTERHEEALLAIVTELGGRAGTRLAAELGLMVERDALLSRAKGIRPDAAAGVRVLGVDDFAFRKGHTYGTILVDLLPECSQESLAGWLRRNPGVEVATRDRSRIYREALTKGAPGAAQVVDRWHLLRGLGLEEFLLRKRSALGKAAAPGTGEQEGAPPGSIGGDASTLPVRLGRPYGSVEGPAEKRHEREEGRHRRRLPDRQERRGSVHAPGGMLNAELKGYLERLCASDPALDDARRLTQFAEMVRNLEGEKLHGWLGEAEASGAQVMKKFAAGLKKDLAAVRAGLTEKWSNGPVEGFVNKLKLVKRQGHGRAGSGLLRARVLAV
jgi:transposase